MTNGTLNLTPYTVSDHAPHGIGPVREGGAARVRAAFTAGESVGYNAHHEGVRHVAREAAAAAAKIRGPPTMNR